MEPTLLSGVDVVLLDTVSPAVERWRFVLVALWRACVYVCDWSVTGYVSVSGPGGVVHAWVRCTAFVFAICVGSRHLVAVMHEVSTVCLGLVRQTRLALRLPELQFARKRSAYIGGIYTSTRGY